MSFHGATDTDIDNALRALKRTLENKLSGSLEKIVLFGSRARGDFDENSDIDIAIVVQNLDLSLKKEILDLVADVELEYLVPLSTFVISMDDFSDLLRRERRIALDIEKDGVPL